MENNKGYVYVMINPSYEGLVKIGKTAKAPEERAKELSSATGIATPFIVVYHRVFSDCHSAEKMVHNLLTSKGYRVNRNREFFKIPINTAINTIINLPDNNSSAADANDEEDNFDKNIYLELANNYHWGYNGSVKDYDKALLNYKEALKITKYECDIEQIWDGMSSIYEEQGKLHLAIDYILKIIESIKKRWQSDDVVYRFLHPHYRKLCQLYSRSKRIEDQYNSQRMWNLFFECGQFINIDKQEHSNEQQDDKYDYYIKQSYAKDCIEMSELYSLQITNHFDIVKAQPILLKFRVEIEKIIQEEIKELPSIHKCKYTNVLNLLQKICIKEILKEITK